MNQQMPARPVQVKQQAQKLPVFEVVKISPVGTGTLKCFADVQIGRGPNAFTVCKWRLIQQDQQRPWLSPLQEIWTTDTGERRYANLSVYPKEWRDGITLAVIEAWEQKASGGQTDAE